MIDLTPLDVRNKRGDFKKIMRGYDPHEVDVFLEIAADRLETLVRENIQLRERTQTLQIQVDAQVGREHAVQEALVTAQALRADIQSQSQREADHVLREAESAARRLLAEAEVEARGLVTEAEAEVRSRMRGLERQLDHAQDSIQELERRRVRFLKEFKSMLEREMDVVQVEEGRVPYEERTIELDIGGRHRSGGRNAGPDAGTGSTVVATTSAVAVQGTVGGPSGGQTAPDLSASKEPASDESAVDAPAVEGLEGKGSAPVTELEPMGAAALADDVLPLEALEPDAGDALVSSAGPAEAPAPVPAPEVVDVRPVPPFPPAAPPVAGSVAPEGPSAAEMPHEAVSGTSVPPAAPPSVPSAQAARPSAPPAAVGDEPSSLELELMAGAAEGGRAGERERFADIPDLETLLAESGEELKPPTPRDIAPPAAPGVIEDNLILFDPNAPESGS